MSAAYDINAALKTALEGDAQLSALGVTYHAGHAPERTAVPYIVGDGSAENPRGLFGARGYEGRRSLHIWAKNETTTLLVYKHVARVLHYTTIPIEGHVAMSGETRIVTSLLDFATGKHHLVAEYASWVKELAV